jgi:hypothetical protein
VGNVNASRVAGRSGFRPSVIPLRWAPEWHQGSQVYFPSCVQTADDILSTVSCPRACDAFHRASVPARYLDMSVFIVFKACRVRRQHMFNTMFLPRMTSMSQGQALEHPELITCCTCHGCLRTRTWQDMTPKYTETWDACIRWQPAFDGSLHSMAACIRWQPFLDESEFLCLLRCLHMSRILCMCECL